MTSKTGTAQRSQQRRSTSPQGGGRAKPCMLSSDYVAGLTDGEGSFCVFIRKPAKKTWKTRVECHFYIKMREDELPLLEEVRDFFGCGRISFQKEYRPGQRDNFRFQVSNLKDLRDVIIPVFQKNSLHSVKRKRDFEIFRDIVSMVTDEKHRTRNGLQKIITLKSKMHA